MEDLLGFIIVDLFVLIVRIIVFVVLLAALMILATPFILIIAAFYRSAPYCHSVRDGYDRVYQFYATANGL